MGQLYYGDSTLPITIPDLQLSYLRVVATTKLRRSESFTVSWSHTDGTPGARSSVWLQSSIPLRFVFDSPELEQLDTACLRDLAAQANSPAGLTLDLTVDVESGVIELPMREPAHAA